jgi:predicted Zn-dependent protease
MPSSRELPPLDEMMARLEKVLAASPADSTEIAWIEVRRDEAGGGQRPERGRQEGAGAGAAGPGETASRAGSRGGADRRRPAASPQAWETSSSADAPKSTSSERRERTIMFRVRQGGRTGLHRTGACELSELENALRDALAQARLAPPSPPEALAGTERRGESAPPGADPGETLYHDPELAGLNAQRAQDILGASGAAPTERIRLAWLEGRVVVANNAGLRRAVSVTAVSVTAASIAAACGQGAGAGSATSASRYLSALDLGSTLARARAGSARPGGAAQTQGRADAAAAASGGVDPANLTSPGFAANTDETPLLLSEQSAAQLLDLLNRFALSAAAIRDGTSWLCGRLGETLFAPCVNLTDDAANPLALPFPFDLAGWPKRQVDLIQHGAFLTPAVDARLAQDIGRPPTPHALAPDESIAANLFLHASDTGAQGAHGAPENPENPENAAPDPNGLPDSTPSHPAHTSPDTGGLLAYTEPALLHHTDRGLWIGALDAVECYDPRRLHFRAIARGVRRIAGGELAEALPDLVWDDCLPAVLARVTALGDRPVAIPIGDMLFGAIACPLLAIQGASRLTALRAAQR